MFTCQYCGTQFMEHQPNCPNCGAAIKVDKAQAVKHDPATALEAIREICSKYQELDPIHFDDAIDAKRLANVTEKFEIPADEKVILLYDDTVFSGKNDVGFAVGSQGLYWRNSWTTTSKRNKLSWDEFAKREIGLNDLMIQLGSGDQIGVAGCGSNETREKLLAMLKEIQGLFKSKSPA